MRTIEDVDLFEVSSSPFTRKRMMMLEDVDLIVFYTLPNRKRMLEEGVEEHFRWVIPSFYIYVSKFVGLNLDWVIPPPVTTATAPSVLSPLINFAHPLQNWFNIVFNDG
ncbi:hypothetical protein HanIR_Chr06g0273551 [Helianthus annuus]|nr:hypothetical protein HanIR_Chr06g0273551 [Helianthus annuus]